MSNTVKLTQTPAAVGVATRVDYVRVALAYTRVPRPRSPRSASPRRAGATPTEPSHPSRSVKPWLVLVVACLAQFMVVLDLTVVNVALPSVQRGLHFSATNLQWVINSYTLVFGGLLLLGGRAADLLGRRRLFIVGVLVFSGASLLNGLAQSSGMLILGRGLQGLGAALVSPAALSIVTTTFSDTAQRTKALAVWAAIGAGGSAVGLLVGGALTELASWRWIFFINMPIGLATIVLALRFVAESRAHGTRRSYDLAGAATVTGGLVLLVYAIVKVQTYGWGSARTLGLGGAALAMLAAFIAIEHRSQAPLMRLSILRVRSLIVGDAALLCIFAGMFGMFFFASLYVQDILGYSPLTTGVAFLPVTIGLMLASAASQRLLKRLGVRNVAVLGSAVATVGMLLLTQLPVHGSYARDLLVGLIPFSIGAGLALVPLTVMATSAVAGSDSGLASGLYNVARTVGGALGLAVMSTLAASHTTSLLQNGATAPLAARVSGYHVAFLAAAVMVGIGGALPALLLRRRHTSQVDGQIAPPDVGQLDRNATATGATASSGVGPNRRATI
jgi:EmrB/QacA subfamily drug resistance transporter